jgi:hypothetical protein
MGSPCAGRMPNPSSCPEGIAEAQRKFSRTTLRPPLGRGVSDGAHPRPAMSDRDDFLTWVKGDLHDAEVALHNGDAAPRRALWSRNEPVSVLGHGAAPSDSTN